MGEEDNTRLLQLLQISIDLRDQMAEVDILRNTLQLAENARRGRKVDMAKCGSASCSPLANRESRMK